MQVSERERIAAHPFCAQDAAGHSTLSMYSARQCNCDADLESTLGSTFKAHFVLLAAALW